jgi:hypothetical protein
MIEEDKELLKVKDYSEVYNAHDDYDKDSGKFELINFAEQQIDFIVDITIENIGGDYRWDP